MGLGKRELILLRMGSKTYCSGNGCWKWKGYIDKNGYGAFYSEGKLKKAHRVMYEVFFGEIKSGFVVRHTCANTRCVNPKHLILGTQKENCQDTISHGNNYFLRKKHCKNGHKWEGDNFKYYPGRPTVRICILCLRIRIKKFRLKQKRRRQ